ncbi:MAG: hypothetical protein AAGF31_11940 [Planctomycetota bacterium]
MIGIAIISLTLLTLSGVLIDQHRRAWFVLQADKETDKRGRRFGLLQYRRRMVGSSTIGLVGALIAVHPVVPRVPLWAALYLAVLVSCCVTILICGLLDALAGARFYKQVQLEERLKQATLAFELQQAQKNAATTTDET